MIIKTEIINDKSITNEGLAMYAALSQYKQLKVDTLYVHINSLEYILNGNKTCSLRSKETLRKGIENLIDNGIITCIYEYRGFYLFDIKQLGYDPADHYISISMEELIALRSASKFNFNNLLRYYFILISTLDYKSGIGNCSLSRLAHISDSKKDTVIRYNKLLEDLGLINVKRAEKLTGMHTPNNIYTRAFKESK